MSSGIRHGHKNVINLKDGLGLNIESFKVKTGSQRRKVMTGVMC